MKIRKGLTFIIILLLIFNSTASFASNAPPLSSKTLLVAGDNNYPPYEYLDTNGVYKGFNVDIMRAIALEMGLDIEFIPTSWEKAVSMLQNGEVDAIQGMTVTPEREEAFDFTDQIVENTQSIFVLSDTTYITDLDDLRGKKVSVQADDVTNEILQYRSDITITQRINQYESIGLLLNGEVDAYIGNRLTGIYNIQRFDLTESVKLVGDPISTTPYSIAVNLGNEELQGFLNEGLSIIKENGTYEKIYAKWFGETIEDIAQEWKDAIYILITIIVITLSTLLFIYLLNKRLKREVEERTQELNLSNKFKDKVLNNIENGIIAFDENMRVLQNNPLSSKLLSMDIYEGMDYNEIISDKIPKEGIDKVLNGETWESSLEWTMENGENRYVYCTISPINPKNNKEGFIISINDRTEEVKLSNLAKHSDKMQALGVLSAGLAHELRNPLTSIKAFIDLIPLKINDEGFKNELINIVPKELDRLDHLVGSLLDYSKPGTAQPKLLSLGDVIHEIKTLFKKEFQTRNTKLITVNTDIKVFVDESQLKQILINIILNSLDAIIGEGIIEISCIEENKLTTITIKDNGKGIEEEELEKLFNPFYTSKNLGYGIGLSITDRLVRENNGSISIESELGVGTSVIIRIPNSN